jgi:hypothetical protein
MPNKTDSNICYQLKCASVDRVAKVLISGRTFARLPQEIYSKLIDEKIATVTSYC